MKFFHLSLFITLHLALNHSLSAVNPNQIISRGKTVYTSSGNAAYLVDNKFGGTSFNVNNNTWIAINLGAEYDQVFVSWNNPNYTWSDVVASAGSCKQSPIIPINYTIQGSSNSTNGTNGQWNTLLTVTGNVVTARGHSVQLNASWVKINITQGGGSIDEIEVFDQANGGSDLWFFPGTSISANTYKGTVPAKNFADLITQFYPAFTPAMVRGGIPCINSTQFKNDLQKYLDIAGNAKYWAIEMGTNDGYNNGNSNVATFKSNLQQIITACKNAGIQPIIARVIGTNASAAGWQIHGDYIKAVDDLTLQNNLIEGPDFYTWFSTHPTDLNSDGIHPNASGAAQIQRLWAEKVTSLYAVTHIENEVRSLNRISICPNPTKGGIFKIILPHTSMNVSLEIYNSQGSKVYLQHISATETMVNSGLTSGVYVLNLRDSDGNTTCQKLVVE